MSSALESAPRHTKNLAPRKVKHHFRHHHKADGLRTVSHWKRHELPPLYSFQVYVAYDVSAANDSELETLAKNLHYCLFGSHGMGSGPARFDIHLIGPGASTQDCVAHYRRVRDNPPAHPSMRIVPSYACTGFFYYHSLFFKINDPDWKREYVGLMEVCFDHVKPSSTPRVHERAVPASEALETTGDVYHMQIPGSIVEDCEAVYEAALAANLTDW
ncbi:uncharacterized protein BKA78DRAFT_355192 [Phyllosticta capitalensis]|uniref:uncharacterized protein n=1 Tax=Phyllosticta capitalensis TaxID=121624 RepID=UPI0031312A72